MTKKQLLDNLILLPASKLYGAGVWVRNKMFDLKMLKQHTFDVPVVSVGNLVAGGTGKTPHVEYIIHALRYTYHIGVLSRGYKRHTRGFVMATSKSTPSDIGDEAYQVYSKFSGDVTVAVCEDRVKGIHEMLRVDPAISLILLDDAYQHRYVKPAVSVLLTEHNNPYSHDRLLPLGRLRERASEASRADMIVVTKCPPQMKPLEYSQLEKHLEPFPFQSLHYSHLSYGAPRPVFTDVRTEIPRLDWLNSSDTVLLLVGIGNPRPFVRYIRGFDAKVKINIYPDHHRFTRKDIEEIRRRYDSMTGVHRYILTTEKDAVRLSNNPYFPHDLKAVTFYIPIRIDFERRDGASFLDVLQKRLDRWTAEHR